MPKTLEEYHQLWRETGGFYEDYVEPNGAIISAAPWSLMGGGGYNWFTDFGHLVCHCRYQLVPNEFGPSEPLQPSEYDIPFMRVMAASWEKAKPKLSEEELARRRAVCEEGFDRLLEEFVRDGYKPEMGKRLLEIANANFLDWELYDVFVLPDDLEELLKRVGNPLVDPNEEDEEAAETVAHPFDLNNPEHQEALAYRLHIAG